MYHVTGGTKYHPLWWYDSGNRIIHWHWTAAYSTPTTATRRQTPPALNRQQRIWKRTKHPERGQRAKFLTELTFWKGRKEETTFATYFSPPSTVHTSLLGNILFHMRVPETEERFHMQSRHSTCVSLTSPCAAWAAPALISFLKWLVLFSPSLEMTVKPGTSFLLEETVLFREDARQERKGSLIFSSLYIQGLTA